MPRNERRPESRSTVVSKTLSRVLRHSAEQEKIELSPQGYAKISDLLKWRKAQSLKITFDEILEAVVENNKQRFALLYQGPTADKDAEEGVREGVTNGMQNLSLEKQATTTQIAREKATLDQDPRHYLIRATQGHSIKTIESAEYLEPITLDKPESIPDTVVHGTYHAAWPLILATGGLKPMSRVHAHFATGPSLLDVMPEGLDGDVKPRSSAVPGQKDDVVISGMRSDAQILIYINIRKALEAGVQFWRSENGVILSEGKEVADQEKKIIGTDFFDVVVETKQKLGLLWRDGNTVKELPQELIKKGMPRGKGQHHQQQQGGSQRGKSGKRKDARPKVNMGKDDDVGYE